MSPFDAGSCETAKRGVHRALEGLAALCVVYNSFAWLKRRETHLAVNVVLYGALVAYERMVIARHQDQDRSTGAGTACRPRRARVPADRS